jgi:hypothetical protein
MSFCKIKGPSLCNVRVFRRPVSIPSCSTSHPSASTASTTNRSFPRRRATTISVFLLPLGNISGRGAYSPLDEHTVTLINKKKLPNINQRSFPSIYRLCPFRLPPTPLPFSPQSQALSPLPPFLLLFSRLLLVLGFAFLNPSMCSDPIPSRRLPCSVPCSPPRRLSPRATAPPSSIPRCRIIPVLIYLVYAVLTPSSSQPPPRGAGNANSPDGTRRRPAGRPEGFGRVDSRGGWQVLGC